MIPSILEFPIDPGNRWVPTMVDAFGFDDFFLIPSILEFPIDLGKRWVPTMVDAILRLDGDVKVCKCRALEMCFSILFGCWIMNKLEDFPLFKCVNRV